MGDAPIHQVTSQHLVHLCGRHADSPCHKSSICTLCGRHAFDIWYICLDDASNCKLRERTRGVRSKVSPFRTEVSEPVHFLIGPMKENARRRSCLFDVPIGTIRFATRTYVFLSTCVGDTPIHQVTMQLFAHLCGRHADSPGHKSTCGTCVWATRRFTRSQANILYMCVGDTPIHKVTSQHLVRLCGRHADSPCHK